MASRWRSASSSLDWPVRLTVSDLIRGAYLEPALTSAGPNSSGTGALQGLAAVAAERRGNAGSRERRRVGGPRPGDANLAPLVSGSR